MDTDKDTDTDKDMDKELHMDVQRFGCRFSEIGLKFYTTSHTVYVRLLPPRQSDIGGSDIRHSPISEVPISFITITDIGLNGHLHMLTFT
jgi:hypothetical protein